MLSLARKFSQSSAKSDSFTVFDDSSLSTATKPVEKHDMEVQTELAFLDAVQGTTLSISADHVIEEEENKDADHVFWQAVADMKKAQLERTRRQNQELEEQIRSTEEKKKEVSAEYERLFTLAAAALEAQEETESDE